MMIKFWLLGFKLLLLVIMLILLVHYLVSFPFSERWILHSTVEYAQSIISQTGLQKPSDAVLRRVSEELFQALQSTGINISQPFFKKAHRWSVLILVLQVFLANCRIIDKYVNNLSTASTGQLSLFDKIGIKLYIVLTNMAELTGEKIV